MTVPGITNWTLERHPGGWAVVHTASSLAAIRLIPTRRHALELARAIDASPDVDPATYCHQCRRLDQPSMDVLAHMQLEVCHRNDPATIPAPAELVTRRRLRGQCSCATSRCA